jgi:hypothetical protein
VLKQNQNEKTNYSISALPVCRIGAKIAIAQKHTAVHDRVNMTSSAVTGNAMVIKNGERVMLPAAPGFACTMSSRTAIK